MSRAFDKISAAITIFEEEHVLQSLGGAADDVMRNKKSSQKQGRKTRKY